MKAPNAKEAVAKARRFRHFYTTFSAPLRNDSGTSKITAGAIYILIIRKFQTVFAHGAATYVNAPGILSLVTSRLPVSLDVTPRSKRHVSICPTT